MDYQGPMGTMLETISVGIQLKISLSAAIRGPEPKQRLQKPQLPFSVGEQADASSPPVRGSQSSDGSDGAFPPVMSPPYSAPAAQGTDSIIRESETGERVKHVVLFI